MPQILIVRTSRTETSTVEAVLRDAGITPVCFDTDRFPGEVRASLLEDGSIALVDGDQSLPLDDLRAIWYRRARYAPPIGLPPEVGSAVLLEARAFVQGLLERFRPPVFQAKSLLDAAERKPRQLSVARRCGLDIPRTIVSTDGAALRAFAATVPGDVITKVVTSLVVGDPIKGQVVMTSVIGDEDLASLADVEAVPVMLQEKLDKEREYRVTVVGERVFACSIDTRGDEVADVDWRRRADGDGWQPDTLPDDVARALVRTAAQLGLTYGAADIVHTTDGRHVFLEINPAGEYLWVDALHDGAISRAIGEHLVQISGVNP